jgi:hypothetical protein
MKSWQRRCLSVLLLLLLASSMLLPLLTVLTSRAEQKLISPLVLVEAFEAGESDPADEFVPLIPMPPSEPALAIGYTDHIAEECEFYRAQLRKLHFWRGPPLV